MSNQITASKKTPIIWTNYYNFQDYLFSHYTTIHVIPWGFYWEKCDGKTTRSSKLESSGTDMITQAKTATNNKYTSDLSPVRF